MSTVIRRTAACIATATLGVGVGLAAHPATSVATTATENRPSDCQTAVAYADQLVATYADAYTRTLAKRLTVDEIYDIQSDLATTGAAYVARRNGCEAGR